MKVLVTGSSGLIGSTAVRHWDAQGSDVIGVDNDMRQVFFGEQGSTLRNLELLNAQTKRFESHAIDVRDREAIFELIRKQAGSRSDRQFGCDCRVGSVLAQAAGRGGL
jgi:CDP-paratose 2-epimerase